MLVDITLLEKKEVLKIDTEKECVIEYLDTDYQLQSVGLLPAPEDGNVHIFTVDGDLYSYEDTQFFQQIFKSDFNVQEILSVVPCVVKISFIETK